MVILVTDVGLFTFSDVISSFEFQGDLKAKMARPFFVPHRPVAPRSARQIAMGREATRRCGASFT